MAAISMIKFTPSAVVNVAGRRQLRSVGASRATAMAPRLRSACKTQAFYLPYNQGSCRSSSSYRSPRFGLGLARPARQLDLLGGVFTADWLRETTSCVHPVDIKTVEDRYELQSDCPGMGEEDMEVSVSPDRVLTITGRRKTSRPAQQTPANNKQQPAEADDGEVEPVAAAASEDSGYSAPAATAAPSSSSDVAYKFSRSFVLPEDADVEGVAAALDRGVLTVTIPRVRVEKPKPRRVSIRSSTPSPTAE